MGSPQFPSLPASTAMAELIHVFPEYTVTGYSFGNLHKNMASTANHKTSGTRAPGSLLVPR